MDEATRYLIEAQSYLNQLEEYSYESMLTLEDGEDSVTTANKNNDLKKKANGSILKAIGALIESLGSLISTLLGKIKVIFFGKDNAPEALKAQYSALVQLIPNETNSYKVKVKNYRKFYADVRKTLSDIEKARKSKNTDQVKILRDKLNNYFNTDVPEEEVSLNELINIMESSRETSNSEVKHLERLKADLQKTMNNLNSDDAQSNGEETAEIQWETQQATKSIGGWFKSVGDNAKVFGHATKDLINVAKSKGKDVGSLLDLVKQADQNPALRSLMTGLTGAAASVLDRKSNASERTMMGSALRVTQSAHDGKTNVGAVARLAHNALKDDTVMTVAGTAATVGSTFITPGQQKAKKAASNTVNQLLS